VAHAPSRGLERLAIMYLKLNIFSLFGVPQIQRLLLPKTIQIIFCAKELPKKLHFTSPLVVYPPWNCLPGGKMEIRHFVSYSVRDSATEDHSRKLPVARQ
jgi:hypothetical protein